MAAELRSRLRRALPVFEWLPGYGRPTFTSDLAAGLTVGAVLIPQGMAYALVAGLPPVAGLYAAVFPIVAYAALGRSRQLALGPVAIVSLLTAAGLQPLAGGDTQEYVNLAATLALMVGALMILMGVARLTFVSDLLSHPCCPGSHRPPPSSSCRARCGTCWGSTSSAASTSTRCSSTPSAGSKRSTSSPSPSARSASCCSCCCGAGGRLSPGRWSSCSPPPSSSPGSASRSTASRSWVTSPGVCRPRALRRSSSPSCGAFCRCRWRSPSSR